MLQTWSLQKKRRIPSQQAERQPSNSTTLTLEPVAATATDGEEDDDAAVTQHNKTHNKNS